MITRLDIFVLGPILVGCFLLLGFLGVVLGLIGFGALYQIGIRT